MRTAEETVRRYYEVVGDLGSTREDLEPLLADDLLVIEHPNPVSPQGKRRGKADTLAGFEAGKALLREQAFDVHEVLAAGDRVAVRATWTATIGVDAGPFVAGQTMTSHVASFLTVTGGRVAHHETFDCYEPFAPTDDVPA